MPIGRGASSGISGAALMGLLLLSGGCGDSSESSTQSVPTLRWRRLCQGAMFGDVRVALWTPVTEIPRGSVVSLFVALKNVAHEPVMIPKDIFGRLGMEVTLDGKRQDLLQFDYRCPDHEHPWMMNAGETLLRSIPVFTGGSENRLRDFEDIHNMPVPVDVVYVGVYAGNATNIVVRCGLMAATNRLDAGASATVAFHVLPPATMEKGAKAGPRP